MDLTVIAKATYKDEQGNDYSSESNPVTIQVADQLPFLSLAVSWDTDVPLVKGQTGILSVVVTNSGEADAVSTAIEFTGLGSLLSGTIDMEGSPTISAGGTSTWTYTITRN